MRSLEVGGPQHHLRPRLFDSYQCVVIASGSQDGFSQSTFQPKEGRHAKAEQSESVPEKHSFSEKYH